MKKSIRKELTKIITLSTLLGVGLGDLAVAKPIGMPSGRSGLKVSSIFDIGALFRPPGRSQPRVSMGGGVRGKACDAASENNDSYIQALVPQKESALVASDSDEIALAARTKGLLGKRATLTVTDNKSYLYEKDVTIPGDGIVAVNFDRINELESGEYIWSLQVICGDTPDVKDPSISSYLMITDQKSSTTEDLTARIVEDANQSLWYNALSNALQESDDNYQSLSQLLQAIDSGTPNESVYLVAN